MSELVSSALTLQEPNPMRTRARLGANQNIEFVPHGVLVLPPWGCLTWELHEGLPAKICGCNGV